MTEVWQQAASFRSIVDDIRETACQMQQSERWGYSTPSPSPPPRSPQPKRKAAPANIVMSEEGSADSELIPTFN